MHRIEWSAQFILWVVPTMFVVAAGLFFPRVTGSGWFAMAVGIGLLQWFQWGRQTRVPLLLAVAVVCALCLGFGVVLVGVTLSGTADVRFVARFVGLVLLGAGLRWIPYRHQTFAHRWLRWGIMVLGEWAYVTGWIGLAWTVRTGPTMVAWLEQWPVIVPAGIVVAIMTAEFLGLQAVLQINPTHATAVRRCRRLRGGIFAMVVLLPVVAVLTRVLPTVWLLLGLLWMYSYRTYRMLVTYAAGIHTQTVPHPPIETIRMRTIRETVYYSLALVMCTLATFQTL